MCSSELQQQVVKPTQKVGRTPNCDRHNILDANLKASNVNLKKRKNKSDVSGCFVMLCATGTRKVFKYASAARLFLADQGSKGERGASEARGKQLVAFEEVLFWMSLFTKCILK